MSAGIYRDQKRVLNSLELEFQVVQDLNLGPLQKQFTLLITEPSLCCMVSFYKYYKDCLFSFINQLLLHSLFYILYNFCISQF